MSETVMNDALTQNEREMFAEVFQVMKKYEHVERKFGLQLLHDHFNINADEVLHETHNKQDRTLLVQTLMVDNIPLAAKPTAWSFDKNGKIKVMQFCCDE